MLSLNAYQQLRAQALSTATRDYGGRGILSLRCARCQLKQTHCLCSHRREVHSALEFVLIMHRDELFKPTNTGRLIADTFPQQTHAFCWDRLQPDPALLLLLQDSRRHCLLIFPATTGSSRDVVHQVSAQSDKLLTLIILDGTWKQARRMFNLSPWLAAITALHLQPQQLARYSSRVAAHDHYLSTAESVALALASAEEQQNSDLLLNYFCNFDRHYAAMRSNVLLTER